MHSTDAIGQADLVRTGQVSPAELLHATIAGIEALDQALNAVIRDRFDAAARDVPADGPFRGVPLLLKDAGASIAGEPVGYGLAALQDVPAPVTSHLVDLFRRAGFVIIGRTNVPELLTTVTTEPKDFPPTRNPWDVSRSAGGSSGGSAAAVASGMVAVAHGSDGGGSIRIPASACGLVGLKPSRGRVSHGPDSAEVWAGASTDGVLTRTVRDTAAILDVISVPMPGEPYVAPPPERPFADEVGQDPGRLRIGFTDRPGGEGYLDDLECRAAVGTTVALLESLGHIVQAEFPAALFEDEVGAASAAMIGADTALSLRNYEALLGRPIGDDELERRNVRYRERASAMSAPDYLAARATLGRWSRRMASWWTRFDVLVTPTLGAPPPELGWFTAGSEGRRVRSFIPYTAQFNLTGQPAISLPLHWTADGIPVGVQFAAAYGREDVLIRLAAQLEQAAPWNDRRPPVAVQT